jgi:hypothetical protein
VVGAAPFRFYSGALAMAYLSRCAEFGLPVDPDEDALMAAYRAVARG